MLIGFSLALSEKAWPVGVGVACWSRHGLLEEAWSYWRRCGLLEEAWPYWSRCSLMFLQV